MYYLCKKDFLGKINHSIMKYFLQTKTTQGNANLFFRVARRINDKRVDWWFNSLVTVDIKEWNKSQSSSANLTKYQKSEDGKKVYAFLNAIDDAVENLFSEGRVQSADDKSIIEKVINEIVYREEKERQQQEEVTILKFLDDFVKGIEEGMILHKGKRYSEGSVTIWKSFSKHLRNYMNNNMHTPFSVIDKRWADGFSAFLSSKLGMMPTTVNKNVTCMRKLVNLASEYDIYKGSLKLFPERKVEDFEKKAEVYFTEEEIDALYNMELSGEECEIRDLFILGTLTCQRFSDYAHYTKEDFVEYKGVIFLKIFQKKTKSEVIIQLTDPRIMALIEKYNYNFPDYTSETCKRKFSRVIKRLFKQLTETIPSLAELYVTELSQPERKSEELYLTILDKEKRKCKLTVDEKKQLKAFKEYAEEHHSRKNELFYRDGKGNVKRPKYELATSHSARRSGITNLYTEGNLDTREMMSISGHQSEKVFAEYIKLSKLEQAMKVGRKRLGTSEQTPKRKSK